MADNKEIKFKAVMDMSDFDTGIQKVQQRLKQLQNTSGRLLSDSSESGKELSPQAQRQAEIFREVSTKKMQQLKTDQIKLLEREQKLVEQKFDRLKKIEEMQKDENKTQEEKNKLLAAEKKLRDDILDIQNKSSQREEQISKIDERLGIGRQGGQGGQGGQPPQSTFGKVMDGLSTLLDPKKLATLISGAATGVQMYAGYLGIQKTRDRELLAAQGQSAQAANIGFQSTMQNQGFMNYFEQQERGAAMDMAMQEREARLGRDPIAALGSALMKGLAGAGAGALAGGSAGLGFGAIPGAIIGGAAGIGQEMFGSKNTFKMLFDREAYMGDVNAEMYNNFRMNLANQRALDPEKYAGRDQFMQRQQRFQQLQRRLNMGDRELLGDPRELFSESSERASMQGLQPTRARAGFGQKGQVTRIAKYDGEFGPGTKKGMGYQVESDEAFGEKVDAFNQQMYQREARFNQRQQGKQVGFLEQQMTDRFGEASFSEERIMENINNILGAGGGSAFVRGGGARMAAEYQRAGFTNAAAELGQLSGLGGDAATTEQAYIRLLSEGMKLGINQSELPEETRRFTQMATQIMTQTAGAEGAVAAFSAGMVGTDMASMQAAQSMFERRNQESGQSTGYRGALKQSFLQSREGKRMFGGIDENMKQYFTSANLKNLDRDDMMVQGFADQIMKENPDMSQEDAITEALSRVRRLQQFGENFSADTDKSLQGFKGGYQAYLKEQGVKDSAQARQAFLKTKTGRQAATKAFGNLAIERGDEFGQMNAAEKEAAVFSYSGFEDFDVKQQGVDLKGKGRGADEAEASKAKDQITQLTIIGRQLGELKEAFNTNSKAQVDELIKIALNSEKLKLLENLRENDEETYTKLLRSGIFGGEQSNYVEQPTTGKAKDENP